MTRSVREISRELAQRDRRMLRSLVEMRRASGLTQADVAKTLGVSPRWVRRIETYYNDPRLSDVRRYEVIVTAAYNSYAEPEPIQIGDTVTCRYPDHFLRTYHSVVAGVTQGRVAALSQLHPYDTGVLVEWTHGGGTVRCDRNELTRSNVGGSGEPQSHG